jgi:hypothetical protein
MATVAQAAVPAVAAPAVAVGLVAQAAAAAAPARAAEVVEFITEALAATADHITAVVVVAVHSPLGLREMPAPVRQHFTAATAALAA